MTTRIEGHPSASPQVLVANASTRLRTDRLQACGYPGEYEITNVADLATAIQEHATRQSPDSLSLSPQPYLLMGDSEIMELPGIIAEDNIVYSARVTNIIESLQDQ